MVGCCFPRDTVRENRLELENKLSRSAVMHNPFRYFDNAPKVIRLAVMMYIRYPLSLRQVEDILFERCPCQVEQRAW